MSESPFRIALPEEIGKVACAMTIAFAADPFMRWMYPDADVYMKHFPKFVEAFSGAAFNCEAAFIDESFGAACMWFPPDINPDEEALGQHMLETIEPDKLAGIGEYFRQMEEFHLDGEAWYLPMVGVDARFQGQGLGARLMNWALARTDERGMPTCLESSNPANVTFYKRLGYEAIGKIQISDDSPLMTPMYRAAH